MMNNGNEINLKELEKKAYRSFFQDGLWDIFIGILILNLGILMSDTFISNLEELSLLIITSVWNLIAFFILYFGKKFLTIPRLGYVKFGPKRKRRRTYLKVILLINCLIGIIFFIIQLGGFLPLAEINMILTSLILGFLFITIPFSVLAYILDFMRLFFYGFVFGLGFFLTEILYPLFGHPLDTLFAFIVPSVIIITIGCYYLLIFLHKYPRLEKE
ncbi:MAG: hypothetical protein GF317_10835 [Candidatus Lokiarchaeota archaeon]|nr:hypothetical protein [Candidatus Lokiarchaeota archaeon]MBD3200157.1 hypothetical protein [Candidatus Lokiarchaeota archaeon]